MPRPRRPHRVVDIATQAGLSRATVDRVLHGRDGVRPETVAQVDRAVAELDRQRSQVHLSGTSLILDLVMQAPDRFTSASRAALESELRSVRPALLRTRCHLREQIDPHAAVELLDAVARRGSDGVILKAPDDPAVRDAIARLADAGIPTITYVTDLPASRRTAYVGVDNRSAGATAAYLVSGWAGPTGRVLVTESSSTSHGEREREVGFRATLAQLAPERRIVEVTDTDGVDSTMLEAVREVLRAHGPVDAVYSVGGGNLATLRALEEAGTTPVVFVAHDLDDDNRGLLRRRRISAVLHHDLRADMRRACRLLLQARGHLPGSPVTVPSQVQVVTPYNEPAGLLGEQPTDGPG